MSEMDFEFIDESEIVGVRQRKKKKISSLFDSRIVDRTYIGYEISGDNESPIDPGTKINMVLVRSKIRKSIRNGYLIDLDDYDLSARLSKEFLQELKNYQLEVLFEMVADGIIAVKQNEEKEWIIEKL